MIKYLNQEHAAFRALSASTRTIAIIELLDRAIGCSSTFKLQFDRSGLRRVIGVDDLRCLMPGFPLTDTNDTTLYDFYEGAIDVRTPKLLKQILSPEVRGHELALNYVKSARLRDGDGHTILRIADRGAYLFFSLPEATDASLLAAYSAHQVPRAVIEEVDLDVEGLEP
jgi:hypothetical protein